MRMTFVPPDVEVRAGAPAPTNSVQPVVMSDMLSGSTIETAPLEGDDFRSLLPLLPGVVRDANGRLRIRGGQPTQGALQISSASLIDPSTGDFDLDLPAQSIESVEVLANPFAAEYGRFSSSVTQIRTRSGTNEWDVSVGSLLPRFRGFFRGLRRFEPRLSVRGPIRKDRLFLAQDFQFRYAATPVKSLPGEPEVDLRSFDSFSRLDGVLSPRHLVGGARDPLPARGQPRDDAHLPSGGDDARSQSERMVGRHRGPAGAHPGPRRREHGVDPAVRDRRQHHEHGADGVRAADAERRLLQRPGPRRRQPPVGRGASACRATSGGGSTSSSSAPTCSAPSTAARASAVRSRSVVSTAPWPSASSSARRASRTSPAPSSPSSRRTAGGPASG